MVCGATDADWTDFVAWLSSATNLANLTHFKFTTDCGIHDDDVVHLLHILTARHASLGVIVFEGLVTGTHVLFNRIARLFPNLVGLTLMYRASSRQMRNQSTAWPEPIWAYAVHLAGLEHLRYFAWNNDGPGGPEGFYDQAHETHYDKWMETKDEDLFERDRWTPVRRAGGSITAVDKDLEWSFARSEWNPEIWIGHWPVVLPKGCARVRALRE
ncbi:hypothetical protein DXG03_007350 [Asterophora parasitica]|uniref:Uncharacterized protein n=1 Tax=Asterophora parasitica TaxID=117018 RepID=A0A9P7G7K2_9AGAR|nr:hypothetical protein DXG03_007350 [Asterophora parasitica]